MLQIKNIRKEYKTGSLIQRALDDVSLSLRDNEFVAILGPSGSGKTTLLNIIGGLDRYDTGDLIINGVSTKKYKDRDWDSYRNHTVGFVFQSYNLIPHQTLLANVELALTISGIKAKERKARALEALDKVGLKEQAHKKPNQLSGGQMQRVAIARALVNDPDILLADEPTGALDTETSVHVMDLLKEVAKDRLVVMVTHNPELAEEYANRIVKLKDGKITDDSNPYKPEDDGIKPVHRNLGKASMNFLTALALSFNNLWTKKTRTVLVSFAGSIGIIGIALILSLSTGVNVYINETEEKTLSQYPLQISSSAVSILTMMTGGQDADSDAFQVAPDGTIREVPRVNQILSSFKTNDLTALKDYFDTEAPELYGYTNGVEYSYDLVPQIYYYNPGDNKYKQVNPNNDFESMGLSASSMFSSAYTMNIFYELPEYEELYQGQYDIKAGKWPENSSEAVLVLSSRASVSDFIVYTFGLRDSDELKQMIEDFEEGNETTLIEETTDWSYEDFLGVTFKVLPAYEKYKYDDVHDVWTDMSNDDEFMMDVLAGAQDLKIVGIVMPKEGEDIQMLSSGIYYYKDLIEELRVKSETAEIVLDQLADKDINVLTGVAFDDENEDFDLGDMFSIDEDKMEEAFQFNGDDLEFDSSSLGDTGDIDFEGSFAGAMPQMSATDIDKLLTGVQLKVDSDKVETLMQNLLAGYAVYAAADPTTNYSNLSEAFQAYLATDEGRAVIRDQMIKIMTSGSVTSISQETVNSATQTIMAGFMQYAITNGLDITDTSKFGDYFQAYAATPAGSAVVNEQMDILLAEALSNVNITDEQIAEFSSALITGYIAYAQQNALPDPSKISSSFADYMATPEAQAMVTAGALDAVNMDEIEAVIASNMNGLTAEMAAQMGGAMESVFAQVADVLGDNIQKAMEDTFSDSEDLFTIDEDAFAEAFQVNMDEKQMQSFLAEMMSTGVSSADKNLSDFGYCAEEDISSITIYPKDFESKDAIVAIINDYNAREKEAGNDGITYTDIVGALMKSVTRIVNTISYVLIAFVAISLVVSSIMIGVITYISVLERRKEIGILRAMGASKGNIAQVFNAETVITGFLAGSMGVGISLLLLIPANIIIHTIGETDAINAQLPPMAGIILILLSVVLTLIGGLIPSKTASKQDPVTALRTE